MNRIQKAFDEKKKVFIGFVTAGDPDLATTKELVRAMVKGGAGLIEFGIPFSDPVAEGEVIQKADMRALAAGTTTDKIFDLVAELREETQVPLVFLTYANPIYAYGAEKFFTRCEETGVDGVIIPDIPYEEREEMRPFSEPHHVALVPLIAGIAFEFIRFTGKHDNLAVCRAVSMPGLWMQRFTTREPDDSMIEVAIAAMQAVLPEDTSEDNW